MNRCWAIATRPGSNDVALGFDEGSVIIKMGREAPAVSMDSAGKIFYARQNEIMSAVVGRTVEGEIPDGELLQLPTKEIGRCEIFPQLIQHSPNGRLCVVLGDGEYTIYMALAWRNKAFGDAVEFVWGRGKGQYAIREKMLDASIKIFNDFKESVVFRPDFNIEGINGDGPLLAVRGKDVIAFYDWDYGTFVTQIDGIEAKDLFWSQNGSQLIISTDSSFFKLRYNQDLVNSFFDNSSGGGSTLPEEGIADAFTGAEEVSEKIRTGTWARDCFLYTNSSNKLNYCVGSLTETISHLDRTLYLLGYLPRFNRVFLMDKSHNITSYSLDLAVIDYQTAVLRQDFAAAQSIFPQIQEKDRTRVAMFLESQGHHRQALKITMDPEHRFDLAMRLGELKIAHDIAEADVDVPEHKWKAIADAALANWQFKLAEKAMWQAKDLNGLLLLYTSLADASGVENLAREAASSGRYNVAFTCLLLLNRPNECLDLLIKIGRIPEAAFMARSYVPSRVSEVIALWRQDLGTTNPRIAQSLADPSQYPNLFDSFEDSLKAEKIFTKEFSLKIEDLPSSQDYLSFLGKQERDLIQEMRNLELIEQEEDASQQPQSTNEPLEGEEETTS
eukprot:TRINITY_DN3186_c0_g1_i11.p1 TRINITY_DN3186_c0_g1~~TRINITY_DN3186_c0_g1_i11.p1  ORF type:complete len:615 (-),score=134.07 TRINITY_DN3186_c0_g1_i11:109-1953(-)